MFCCGGCDFGTSMSEDCIVPPQNDIACAPHGFQSLLSTSVPLPLKSKPPKLESKPELVLIPMDDICDFENMFDGTIMPFGRVTWKSFAVDASAQFVKFLTRMLPVCGVLLSL